MADPISACLTIASTAVKTTKLIHAVRAAIKDAPADVNDFFDFVSGLGTALSGIHDTLQSRAGHLAALPSEEKHHADIYRVLRNCNRDLERLRKELPKFVKGHNEEVAKRRKGNILRKAVGRGGGELKGNVSVAWGMYMRDDPRIRFRLERNLKVLHWSMTTIAFAESWEDKRARDSILQDVRDLLRALHASNPALNGPDGNSAGTASSGETEEDRIDSADIEAWTESCFSHTTAVSTQDLPLASAQQPKLAGLDQRTSAHCHRAASPGPSRKELEYMYDENQAIVTRLTDLGLHLNASIYQRKGLMIRERISHEFGEPFTQADSAVMRERLADILLACELSDCTDEALQLLQGIHDEGSSGVTGKDTLEPEMRCRIELKLGRLHLALEQSSEARFHLRNAYTGYLAQVPREKHLETLRDIVELVSKTCALEGNHDAGRAWLNRVSEELGEDFEPPSRTRQMALQWCRANGFDVPTDGQVTMSRHFLFDHLRLANSDSTPLHVAAANLKTNPAVLHEMLKHVDDTDAVDSGGETPLLVAVGQSNRAAVRLFLEHSANGVHARDRSGRTVFHQCQDVEIAGMLLEKISRRGSVAINTFSFPPSGSTHHERRRSSAVPPSYSSSPPQFPPPETPSPGVVSPSLPPEQITLDTTDCYGRTALHYAAKAGDIAMVDVLLSPASGPPSSSLFPGVSSSAAGANPNIQSTGDGTPLVWSISHGRASKADKRAIIRRLIEAGADPRLQNGQNQDAFDALRRLGFPRDEINKMLLLPGGGSPDNRRSSHSYSLRPVLTRKSSVTTASSGGSAGALPETPRSASVGAVIMSREANGSWQGGPPRIEELRFGENAFGLGLGMALEHGEIDVLKEK